MSEGLQKCSKPLECLWCLREKYVAAPTDRKTFNGKKDTSAAKKEKGIASQFGVQQSALLELTSRGVTSFRLEWQETPKWQRHPLKALSVVDGFDGGDNKAHDRYL